MLIVAHSQMQTSVISHLSLDLKVPAGSPARKTSGSGRWKLATAKSSQCSFPPKVIEMLLLTFDSFDGSGLKNSD